MANETIPIGRSNNKSQPNWNFKTLCKHNLAYLRQKCFMVLGHVHEMFMLKTQYVFLGNKQWNSEILAHISCFFMPTIIVITSCQVHALFMPSSCCSWAWTCMNWAWIKELILNLIQVNHILMRMKSRLDVMHISHCLGIKSMNIHCSWAWTKQKNSWHDLCAKIYWTEANCLRTCNLAPWFQCQIKQVRPCWVFWTTMFSECLKIYADVFLLSLINVSLLTLNF